MKPPRTPSPNWGGGRIPMTGDLTNLKHLDRVYAKIDKEFGRIDILGNVAGEAKAGPAEDMTLAQISSRLFTTWSSVAFTAPNTPDGAC